MFYNPTTHKEVSSGKKIGVLGMNADNCAGHGFVVYAIAPHPDTSITQRAVLDDRPTEIGGVWLKGWTVIDLSAEDARAIMPALSRAQFAGALALSGTVTAAEARAWGKNGDLPSFCYRGH